MSDLTSLGNTTASQRTGTRPKAVSRTGARTHTSEPGHCPASGGRHQLLDHLQHLHPHGEAAGGATGQGQPILARSPSSDSSLPGPSQGPVPLGPHHGSWGAPGGGLGFSIPGRRGKGGTFLPRDGALVPGWWRRWRWSTRSGCSSRIRDLAQFSHASTNSLALERPWMLLADVKAAGLQAQMYSSSRNTHTHPLPDMYFTCSWMLRLVHVKTACKSQFS